MEFVDQLKSAIDIVDVVGQYVQLRKVGASPRHMGRCPFHTEKTPSFSVHSTRQFYHCFGCGAHGDAIKFVMEIQQLSFYEALKLLAERYGIPMPKRAEYSDPETKLRAAIYRMHEIAQRIFQANLNSSAGNEARAYLKKREVAPALIEEFGLGAAERSGQALVRAFEKEGFDREAMEASGLVRRRNDGSGHFDGFRGRLMFPIQNETGKIIGFGGRALSKEDEPKYLNSPETPIYRKTHVVYNLSRAREAIRKQGRAVLVEGYMDVIGVRAAGVHEAVASCGTALTSQQVRAIKRHSENIVVNFDADAAGVKAAERSIQILLEEGVHIKVLELDGGLDPDEYVKQRGAEAYLARLEHVPGYFHWLADRARARHDVSTAEGRVASLQFLLPAIQQLSDKLERAAVASDIATYLNVPPGMVLDYFRKTAADRGEKTLAEPKQEARPIERILLGALLASEEARREALPRLRNSAALEQFSTKRIFQALLAVCDGETPFRYDELDARLEERDRETLAAIAFSEEESGEETALEHARACLRTLAEGEHEALRSSLRSRIKEASRAGDVAEARKLTEEMMRLDRG